jgi:ABC-2 type transport system ATP-binding protein
MIEVENLTKRYGPHTAVENVSFRVQKGEILGFLGPNGAGKTTTMRIVTGYLPASAGTARIAGHDVFENPIEAKRHIGYLPETPPLYPDMRVSHFLEFVAKVKGVPARERKARIDEAMQKARITDVPRKVIGRLSKGYRQRVGLAQALLGNPDVLILDEPTSGLDPKQIVETREMIKSLGGEHTVVLSTHILHDVGMTCGRVLIISKGRVVAEDTPENLTRRVQGGSDALVVDARGDKAALELAIRAVSGIAAVRPAPRKDTADGVVSFEVEAQQGRDIRADVARAVVQKGFDLVGLQRLRLSLEDIFLQLTTTDTAAGASAQEPPPQPAPATEVSA